MKAIIKNLPFTGVIVLNILSEASMHSLETVKTFVLIINIILILNLLLATKIPGPPWDRGSKITLHTARKGGTVCAV